MGKENLSAPELVAEFERDIRLGWFEPWIELLRSSAAKELKGRGDSAIIALRRRLSSLEVRDEGDVAVRQGFELLLSSMVSSDALITSRRTRNVGNGNSGIIEVTQQSGMSH
jgi:hypothetical protein